MAEVAKEAMLKGDEAIDDDYWRKVFRNTVPLSKTNPEAIDAIRVWGRERAVPASGQAKRLERLRRRDLVDEVQVHEEQVRLPGGGADDVTVPDLLSERFGHGQAPNDSVAIASAHGARNQRRADSICYPATTRGAAGTLHCFP